MLPFTVTPNLEMNTLIPNQSVGSIKSLYSILHMLYVIYSPRPHFDIFCIDWHHGNSVPVNSAPLWLV